MNFTKIKKLFENLLERLLLTTTGLRFFRWLVAVQGVNLVGSIYCLAYTDARLSIAFIAWAIWPVASWIQIVGLFGFFSNSLELLEGD